MALVIRLMMVLVVLNLAFLGAEVVLNVFGQVLPALDLF